MPSSSTLRFLLLATLLPHSRLVSAQTTTASSPTATDSSYTAPALFQSSILTTSNLYRTQHSASPLTWNASLADFAANYQTSSSCEFAHSGGPDGENLAEGYPNATAAIQAWGNERAEYDFSNPGFSEETGHFTQLVWKATKTVGCARQDCGGQGWYVVCEYWPPGNVEGEFGQEVGEQVDGPSQSGMSNVCVQGGVCSAGVRARGLKGWKQVLGMAAVGGAVVVVGMGI